jgi:hypothetical protein
MVVETNLEGTGGLPGAQIVKSQASREFAYEVPGVLDEAETAIVRKLSQTDTP